MRFSLYFYRIVRVIVTSFVCLFGVIALRPAEGIARLYVDLQVCLNCFLYALPSTSYLK